MTCQSVGEINLSPNTYDSTGRLEGGAGLIVRGVSDSLDGTGKEDGSCVKLRVGVSKGDRSVGMGLEGESEGKVEGLDGKEE